MKVCDFRGKNYNRNTTKRKIITFFKRESNLFNGKRGEKYNFAPKFEAATLAGARVNFKDSAETFLVSKWTRIFQISFLTWTSKIQKIKLQTEELNKMADEELEKSIDDQKSVNTCRSTKKKRRVLGRIWVR